MLHQARARRASYDLQKRLIEASHGLQASGTCCLTPPSILGAVALRVKHCTAVCCAILLLLVQLIRRSFLRILLLCAAAAVGEVGAAAAAVALSEWLL
jgi:hypothetical protein